MAKISITPLRLRAQLYWYIPNACIAQFHVYKRIVELEKKAYLYQCKCWREMYCVYPAATVKIPSTDKVEMGILPIHHFSPFPSGCLLPPCLCQLFLLSRNTLRSRLWDDLILETTSTSLPMGQSRLPAELSEDG